MHTKNTKARTQKSPQASQAQALARVLIPSLEPIAQQLQGVTVSLGWQALRSGNYDKAISLFCAAASRAEKAQAEQAQLLRRCAWVVWTYRTGGQA